MSSGPHGPIFFIYLMLLKKKMDCANNILAFHPNMLFFLQDWWNSSNFAGYYRTWNVVVHDWLYSYIYKDVYKVCSKQI